MVHYVAADIGGTKCRLRLWSASPDGDDDQQLDERIYKSQKHAHLTDVLADFLKIHSTVKVDVIACAVCGPVVDGLANLTNLGWVLDEAKMTAALGVKRVVLINDFGGNALGVTRLTRDNVIVFQEGKVNPGAPIGVIGAGTGLGEAFLTWSGDNYMPWSSEGGHSDFAPQTDLQMGLQHFIAKRVRNGQWTAKNYQHYRIAKNAYSPDELWVPQSLSRRDNIRISVERVVSGSALPHIYDYVRCVYPDQINKQVDREVRSTHDPAPVIQKYAKKDANGKRDYLCGVTSDLFIDMYGAETGNMALKLFCFGGLFIAGGVASYMIDLMKEDDRFLKAVHNKGRLSGMTQQVPIYYVKDDCNVGLMGAAILARRTLKTMGLVTASQSSNADTLVKEPSRAKL